MNPLLQLQSATPVFKKYHDNYHRPLKEFLLSVLAHKEEIVNASSSRVFCKFDGYDLDLCKDVLDNFFGLRRIHSQSFARTLPLLGYANPAFPVEGDSNSFSVAAKQGKLYLDERRWAMIQALVDMITEYEAVCND